MNTRNATPGDDFLPGQEFRDRNGRRFAELVSASTASGRLPGNWNLRRIESTASTNDDLVRAAASGAPDRLVLVADHQTAGRGRLDRRWEAPAGENLLVSFLFRVVPDRPHRLVKSVALAAVQACRQITRVADPDVEVTLKWPNDIVIGARKLAGILAVASSRQHEVEGDCEGGTTSVFVPEFVVVGLGLNVRWAPDGAVSLAEFVDDVHRDDVLLATLAALDELIEARAEEVLTRYEADLSTIGRVVRVELPSGEVLSGRALGVGADGRLEVLDSCAITHHIDVADIVHLRLAEEPTRSDGKQ